MCKITQCVWNYTLYVKLHTFWKLHILCNIKLVSLTYPSKILHLTEFFYTTSGCDGCDKYEVWIFWISWIILNQLTCSQLTGNLFIWKKCDSNVRITETVGVPCSQVLALVWISLAIFKKNPKFQPGLSWICELFYPTWIILSLRVCEVTLYFHFHTFTFTLKLSRFNKPE